MTTYYAKTTPVNWDAENAWNTAADGSGTDATHPLAADSICDLNGKAVTLNVDVTVATIQASGATGSLTVSGIGTTGRWIGE